MCIFVLVLISTFHAIKTGILLHARPLVRSTYQKNNLISQQNIMMLWVLKRTVLMRRFF